MPCSLNFTFATLCILIRMSRLESFSIHSGAILWNQGTASTKATTANKTVPLSRTILNVQTEASENEAIKITENSSLSSYNDDIKKSLLWVMAAAAFGTGIGMYKGIDSAIEFFSGYVLEESLSIDNLFVFLVLFDYFKVSRDNQSRVLNYGIIGGSPKIQNRFTKD